MGRAPVPGLRRREAIALLAAPLLPPVAALATVLAPAAVAAAAARGVRTDVITVLYRPATPDAPSRLDPAVQTAIRQLEREFNQRGLTVMQPSADVYRLMDQGQGVVVTFAANAGFSLVFSAYKNLRPVPQQDGGVAELRLESRVLVGRTVLAAEEGRGQMFTRTDEASLEFGLRRAMELAAGRAAAELAERTIDKLKELTPERVQSMLGADVTDRTDAEQVNPLPVGNLGKPPQQAPALTPAAMPSAALLPAAAIPPPAAQAVPEFGAVAVATPAPVPSPLPLPSPAAAAAARQRWALVVGMSSYASVRANGVSGINDLPGVAMDMAKVVAALGELGFQRDRMVELRDEKATSNSVRATMKQFAGRVGPDDLVVLFFSAHGGDKDFSASGYGMPILADFKYNDPSTLDFWELQSLARNLGGKVVWINDTCHSGGAAAKVASVVVSADGVQATRDVRGPDALTVARGTPPGQDFAILTASSPQEVSWETPEGGLFTTRLLKALQSGRGQPLARVFAEQVHPPVVSESRVICRRRNECSEHPQQTPIMAFGGGGDRIVL